jgi:hypothetical protein
LPFAVVLCLIFSSLLTSVLYFLDFNTQESHRNIHTLQAKYLAEAANARAVARLNVKTLPTVFKTQEQMEKEAQLADINNEEEWSDEDWDEWDYNEEEDWSADDEEVQESDFNDLDLTQVPRYINFYLLNPYYINIDKGDTIGAAQYMAMVMQERLALEKAKAAGIEVGDQLLVEELYFPLPEVNVQRIGRIPVPKGMHIKPGFQVVLADHIPVMIRQNDIREEYLSVIPSLGFDSTRPILKAIHPNYGEQGQQVDIRFDGQNIEQFKPIFSTLDIQILERGSMDITAQVADDLAPGRYKLRVGSQAAHFYVVPSYQSNLSPQMIDVVVPPDLQEDYGQQFARMKSSDEVKGLVIEGTGLGDASNSPIIVPDIDAIDIEVVSYTDTKVVFNIKTRGAEPGLHSFTLFNKGGQTNTWNFTIEPKNEAAGKDPGIGSYSTVVTLLYVKSHSNIPLDSTNLGGGGRPDEAKSADDGRPANNPKGGQGTGTARFQRNFDLLKSDMETVWKVETTATVAGQSYKETQIIRRELPRVHAALTTNSRVSFGTSDIQIRGYQEAVATLFEAVASGDEELLIEDPRSGTNGFNLPNANQPAIPTGNAVVEDIWFKGRDASPGGKGFKAGHIVAVIPAGGKSKFSDYAIIDSIGAKQIFVKQPAFEESHYENDEIVQFIPSVITPFGISEQDSERFLQPLGSHISVPGKTGLNYVMGTPLKSLADWTEGISTRTTVPSGVYDDYEGYIGMNIIEGTPSYDGGNALTGQGLLVIDTTLGGLNPSGGLVHIGGGSSHPSQFDGVIYVIGDLHISGNVEISGAVIVQPLTPYSELSISGHGHIAYNPSAITKALIGMPFTRARSARKMEKSNSSEEDFLKSHKDAIKFHEKEGGKS